MTNSEVVVAFLELLRDRLSRGEWTAGQRLPSIRKMSAIAGVSHHTVVRAYGELVSDGLIEGQQGRGFFVSNSTSLSGRLKVFQATEVEDPLYKLLQAPLDVLKLGCGWLPLSWRDTEVLAKAVRKTARAGRGVLVEYGDIQGYFPLRKQLSSHLFKSAQMEVSPNQILTSLGATQALDLALRLLVKPGDRVLVDEPCNGNLIKLLRVHGGVPVGLPRKEDGPDIDVLDTLLSGGKIKAFFCNTTYHNPTGGGLSPRVAFGVLKRAIEHDFVIVEDDVYGDFFPGVRQTFAQLDGFDRVLYVGSFSKSLSASLRIGYMISPPALVDSLVELKMLTSVAVPGFCERFVNTILSDGTYLKHAHAIQRKLMTHQKMAQRVLRKHGWSFDIEPDGGMFLWVRHPDLNDLGSFMASLEGKGILLLPGSVFSISGDCRDRTRINVSLLNNEVARFLDVKGMRSS